MASLVPPIGCCVPDDAVLDQIGFLPDPLDFHPHQRLILHMIKTGVLPQHLLFEFLVVLHHPLPRRVTSFFFLLPRAAPFILHYFYQFQFCRRLLHWVLSIRILP